MRAVVEVLVASLVEHPEQISLKESINGNEITFELSVAQDDMGRIIGRKGRIAKALRTILKAAATKQKTYVNLEIVDPIVEDQVDI
ncbi:MAG: KH domain-containing protein [Symbiobacteriaceae bacterium]|nr:KH domain-containing protein [Symbiobacteriaceae bacterium]